MDKVFVDTSAWIAYISSDDTYHKEVSSALKGVIEAGSVICTSNYVFDETVTRLLYDTSWKQASVFIKCIVQSVAKKTVVKFLVDEQIEAEAIAMIEKYSEHKLSFTDATSVALVKRFKIDAILTLDTDFAKVGLRVLPLTKQ